MKKFTITQPNNIVASSKMVGVMPRLSGLLLAVIVLVSATGCQAVKDHFNPKRNLLKVKMIEAVEDELTKEDEFAGTLIPKQTAEISSHIAGRIKAVYATEGMDVWANDILFTLETADIDALIKQAEANKKVAADRITTAQANVDAAQAALSAAKRIGPQQKSQQESQANYAINAANENIAIAKKNINNAKQVVANAEAALAYDIKEYESARILYEADAITEAEYEQKRKAYDAANNEIVILRNQVGIAEDQLRIAQNALEEARSQKSLASSGASAESAVVEAEGRLKTAQAELAAAKSSGTAQADAALEAAKKQLDNTTIRSDISGYVVNVMANVGEVATPGLTLATVADVSALKLTVPVPQELIGKVSSGGPVSMTVDIYPDTPYEGIVTAKSPVASSEGNLFPVDIEVQNYGELYAGLSARATISTYDTGIIIPRAAVISDNGEMHVFVIEDDIAIQTPVTLGTENDVSVIVKSGLEEGQMVAVTNTNNLFDQMEVDSSLYDPHKDDWEFDEEGNPLYPKGTEFDEDGNPTYPEGTELDEDGNPVYPGIIGDGEADDEDDEETDEDIEKDNSGEADGQSVDSAGGIEGEDGTIYYEGSVLDADPNEDTNSAGSGTNNSATPPEGIPWEGPLLPAEPVKPSSGAGATLQSAIE